MAKRITLYTTTYPAHLGRRWMWFDVAVWHEYPPRVGHLPTSVFDKLLGGILGHRCRQYKSKDEAINDLIQTGCVEAAPPGTEAVKPREWLVPTELVLKEGGDGGEN